MDQAVNTLLEALLANGVGGLLATFFAIGWYIERKDRQEAWRAYNKMFGQTIETLTTVKTLLEVKL